MGDTDVRNDSSVLTERALAVSSFLGESWLNPSVIHSKKGDTEGSNITAELCV